MNVRKIICTTHGRPISTLNFQVKGGFKAWTIYVLLRLVIECRKQYITENHKLDTSVSFFLCFFLFPFPSKHIANAIELYFFTPKAFFVFKSNLSDLYSMHPLLTTKDLILHKNYMKLYCLVLFSYI